MWQEFEMVLGHQPQSNHPSSSSSGSNNGGLVSERLNGLQQTDNSGTGHLSTATEFNESYYNNYHETSGQDVSTTGMAVQVVKFSIRGYKIRKICV